VENIHCGTGKVWWVNKLRDKIQRAQELLPFISSEASLCVPQRGIMWILLIHLCSHDVIRI
jgi:hypothetical protein